ncbi:hypothetical protein SKAU_G00196210 [Synaphobranchus kaupii]|uniref:Uncharacterized protein n=1 Tax=Synaphobranchus kaupii TaxID=118154 RepID=A0A9Q1IVP1_SYNKA|nr:hypothetical protein SKAU_G00196210 [Synaphobranchus kaupii]
MDPSSVQFQHAIGRGVLWNRSRMTYGPRRLLQVPGEEGDMAFFLEYSPPPRDAITLPRHMLYVLVGVILVVVATYAIVGHLINDLIHDLAEQEDNVFFKDYRPPARDSINLSKYTLYLLMATFIVLTVLYAIIGHLINDLLHDLADWMFGKQPEEVMVDLLQSKDKFSADWCPETSPELEELARAEQIKVVMEGTNTMPAIWVISDEPCPSHTGRRVSFGNIAYTPLDAQAPC